LGQLAFATALVSFFTIFADFGLTTLGIREIAQDKTKTHRLAVNITLLQASLSLFLQVILVLLSLLLPIDWRMRWLVFFFGLGMVPQALNIAFIFQAHEKMEWVAVVRVVSQLGYVALGFGLVYVTGDIIYVPVALATTSLLGAAVALWGARRTLGLKLGKIDGRLMKELVLASSPFLISAIAVQIYYNIDSVFLKFWYGDAVVGQYNAAYKVSLLVIMVGNMLVSTLFPLLSASYHHDQALFLKVQLGWARLNGLLAWPIMVGGVVLAQPLLLLLFKRPEFLHATLAFQLLIGLPVLIFWSALYGHPLIAAGRESLTTKGLVLGAVVNMVANVVLIPRYSLNGAAIATLLAEVVVLAYLAWQYRQVLKAPVARLYIRPAIAAVGMGLVLWWVRDGWPVIVSVMIGAVVYGALLLVIGGISRHDVQFWRNRSFYG
jgi:O-antigen/teichoic acid export membrane protein